MSTRKLLMFMTFLPLTAAGGAVFIMVATHKQDVFLKAELAKAFNLSSTQAVPEAPFVLPADPPVRESPAPLAQSSLMPIRDAMGARPVIPAFPITQRIALPPAPPSIAPIVNQPKPVSPILQNLLDKPAQFIVNKTLLGKPARLQGFLQSRSRTERYVNHPVVREALDDPQAVKKILNQPSLVAAFLSSPAMQDPRTVRALFQSPLLAKIMASPGVAEVMKNPAEVQRMLTRPETIAWMSRNPEAASALGRLMQGMSSEMRAAGRKNK